MQESVIIPDLSSKDRLFFALCKHLSYWDEDMAPNLLPDTQVITCFLQRGDKVLVLQRGKKDAQYQLWGIPGGKLNDKEDVLTGLCREIYEETGATLFPPDFTFLGSAISKTSSDGKYGLHLYHAKFPQHMDFPVLNLIEHLSYKWVDLKQFVRTELLHAQKEAFLFVKEKLTKIIKRNKNEKHIIN